VGSRIFLGPDYCITPFSATSEDDTGAALATRAKHRVLEEIDQRTGEHGEDLPWCATLIVELESAVGPLVVAHHKPNWPFPLEVEREQQARRAALAIEEHAGDRPAVVLGDFDAAPESASMLFWRGRRSIDGVSVCYQDAWETARPMDRGLTFTAENPLVRAGEVATDGLMGQVDAWRSCGRTLAPKVSIHSSCFCPTWCSAISSNPSSAYAAS
jgi:hypothetical protein